jgi:hypothetical protein
MATENSKKTWQQVLRYSKARVSRTTIRHHYKQWRREHGLVERCDRETCRFHTEPLSWNNRQLDPILDHINGNVQDNRQENLRYLCPNCDSQLPTRGGANRGRVRRNDDSGFLIVERTGQQSLTVIGTGGMRMGGSAIISCHRAVPGENEIGKRK